jgi:hypothetical protein
MFASSALFADDIIELEQHSWLGGSSEAARATAEQGPPESRTEASAAGAAQKKAFAPSPDVFWST